MLTMLISLVLSTGLVCEEPEQPEPEPAMVMHKASALCCTTMGCVRTTIGDLGHGNTCVNGCAGASVCRICDHGTTGDCSGPGFSPTCGCASPPN
jgi:hypothetical protein